MKSIFTLLLFSVLGFQAKAQWVDLTEGNTKIYGSCIRYNNNLNIYQIDTLCAKNDRINLDLQLEKNTNSYVELLSYFKNVESLNIVLHSEGSDSVMLDFGGISERLSSISITAFGTLKDYSFYNVPDLVQSLTFTVEDINSLETNKWPSNLKKFELYNFNARRGSFFMNTLLPPTLEYLRLFPASQDVAYIYEQSELRELFIKGRNIDITKFNNNKLLEKLTVINFTDELITEMLSIELPNLRFLELYSVNRLEGENTMLSNSIIIENLPPDLDSLVISEVFIDSIQFNENLKYLSVFYSGGNIANILSNVPDNINKLEITGVRIDEFVKIPKHLKVLSLDVVYTKSLPPFSESLDSLTLNSMNWLECLPVFPENLKYFKGKDLGEVACIPNETRYVKATDEWPVCTDDQFICNADEFTIVRGTVYFDLNKNGIKDAGDTPAYGGVLSLNEETFATSNKDGIYKLVLREQGTFEIKAISNHPYYISTSSAVKTIVYDENYVNDSVHFLIQIEDKNDAQVIGSNIVARPGMQTSVTAFAENFGVTDLSDLTVKIKKPQDWSVVDAVPAGYRTDNDTIIWENVSLSKLSQSSFKVQLLLPATAAILGNPYQYEMWVENPDDVSPENNYYRIIDTIRGSYDPNDKIVNHTSLTPENSNAQELIYTIRFQNTGTDTAFKVIVVDTIIGNLDPSSIRVLGASHDFTWEYTGQGIAEFTFDNILLPDSNVNEPASHGFVTLAVKANKDLAVGDSIYNRAGIYFDFNEPVITNKALTRIATVTSVYTQSNSTLKIYPNPAKDRVRVEWNTKERATLTLLDISGKVIRTQTLNQNYSDVDVSRLSKGMYLIQVQSVEGTSVGKLLVQ